MRALCVLQVGKNPLDASGVHPEAYPVVEKILQATAQSIQDLMGNAGVVRQLDAKQFIDEQFGLPTVQDIFKELENRGAIRVVNLKPRYSQRAWKKSPI